MTLRKLLPCIAVGGWLLAAGCNNQFWDPKQVGRFRSVPVQHVILDSLGLAEEEPPAYVEMEAPRPDDVIAEAKDYPLHPGDIVRINIYELLEEGQVYINDFVVTETGKISIPEVGTINAQGLTEQQLEQEIRQILVPDILKSPAVTVTLQASEYRAYSVLGSGLLSDNGGGRFMVPRYDFRLAQALATAGGVSEYNVSYIYVTRQLTQAEIAERLGAGQEGGYVELPAGGKADKGLPSRQEDEFDAQKAEQELLELIAPTDMGDKNQSKPLLSLADVGDGTGAEEARVEWIFEGGKWVPIKVDAKGNRIDAQTATRPTVSAQNPTVPTTTPAEPDFQNLQDVLPSDYMVSETAPARYMVRVIMVPTDALLHKSDPRFNIIIKPGDTITVPSDSIGEFAILGNVASPGYYSLTGRPMTLMQAIAAAKGLGELAAPENVEVRRRIGARHEEIVKVNLKKIAAGLQPDFFIKENDTINVGTDSTAKWLYILRNAFGAQYGFSMTYARNYADRDSYTSRPFGFF